MSTHRDAVLASTSQGRQFVNWFTSKDTWLGGGSIPGVGHLLLQHLVISAAALALAVALGLGLAVALLRLRGGGVFVTSLANTARAIPIVGVLIILAIGPLGLRDRTAILALVIFAIPAVLTNAYTGLRGVDPDIIAAAKGIGMTNGQIMLRVRLPLAIPLIATGVRLAAVQIWATATIAAIIGSGGLGQLITTGYAVLDFGQIYGGTLVIIVTAVMLDGGLARLQRSLSERYGAATSVQRVARAGRTQPVVIEL